jgi:hypothetical protein
MICSREEFLLLLNAWNSSSQTVVVVLTWGSGILSETTTIRVSGFIERIEEEEGLFIVIPKSGSFPNGDYVVIGFENRIFSYGDKLEIAEGAEDVIIVANPSGARMVLFTLKNSPGEPS